MDQKEYNNEILDESQKIVLENALVSSYITLIS